MFKVLLLDIENQTKQLKQLRVLLTQYQQVILVYAASNLNVPLDDLVSLSEAIQQEKLVVVKMPAAGSDAADFGLTFIAGRLSAKLEQGSSVDVMSNDRKLSYAVDLLNQVGIQAQHIKQHIAELNLNAEPSLSDELTTSAENQQSKLVAIEQEIIIKPEKRESDALIALHKVLKKLQHNQPKKLKSLKKSLMSWCNLSKYEADAMVLQLTKHQYIVMNNNAVNYTEKLNNSIVSKSKPKKIENNKVAKKLDLADKPHLQPVKQFARHLLKIYKSRPSHLESLSHVIQSVFKYQKAEQIQGVINLLKKHSLLELNENKVIYHQQTIEQWSA